jgi:hypothetical protein
MLKIFYKWMCCFNNDDNYYDILLDNKSQCTCDGNLHMNKLIQNSKRHIEYLEQHIDYCKNDIQQLSYNNQWSQKRIDFLEKELAYVRNNKTSKRASISNLPPIMEDNNRPPVSLTPMPLASMPLTPMPPMPPMPEPLYLSYA